MRFWRHRFTTADPFETQKELLQERIRIMNGSLEPVWTLVAAQTPNRSLPRPITIIVLMEVNFSQAFTSSMERHFGRCYLDDDRITKRPSGQTRSGTCRSFLKDGGIDSKVPFHLPHRVAAGRPPGHLWQELSFLFQQSCCAGVLVLPIAVVVDQEFAPMNPPWRSGARMVPECLPEPLAPRGL